MLLGFHVSQSSHVLDDKKATPLEHAVKRDLDRYGLNAAQIFTNNPRTGQLSKINYENFKKATGDIDISVHSAYCTVSVWKVNEKNIHLAKSQQILDVFTQQIIATKNVGGWLLVLHITKVQPEVVVETMKLLLPIAQRYKIKIGLEMVSSKAHPTMTYETPEKLNNLVKLIGKSKWYGLVVDLAHIHGAGVHVGNYADMRDWLDRIKQSDKILMFHLNGSYAARGSGKDKHAIPFSTEDIIWGKIEPKKSGLYAVVQFATKHKLVVIMEINRGSELEVEHSVRVIKSLISI